MISAWAPPDAMYDWPLRRIYDAAGSCLDFGCDGRVSKPCEHDDITRPSYAVSFTPIVTVTFDRSSEITDVSFDWRAARELEYGGDNWTADNPDGGVYVFRSI